MIAVPTTSPRGFAVRAVGDVAAVLDFIDGLEDGATGNVVFVGAQGTATGAAFVEAGRVCWAAAQGLARRLTSLLVARSAGALDGARVEELVRACRANGRPIGEHLVELGLIAADGLRSALREHTLESMRTLVQGGARIDWVRRDRGGYAPQFTFSTGELSAWLGVEAYPDAARRAEALAHRVADPSDVIVVFACDEGRGPRPVFAGGPLCLAAWELDELARILVLIGQVGGAIDRATRVMTFAGPRGGGVATLRAGDLLLCALPAESCAMSRSLSRLIAEARRVEHGGTA